jgi:GNAT superfamily N-acetyltransferase
MLKRAGLFYVAVYESVGGVLGCGGLDLNELRLLHVAPGQQGRGIGTALLAHLEGMVPPVLFADIFVYASLSAKGFYRSRGYHEGGEYSFACDGESIRTIFMTKRISQGSRPEGQG